MNKKNTAKAVRAFLKNDDWKFDAAEDWFQTAAKLENESTVLIQINASDFGLIILTALDREIPEEKSAAVMTFANALNALFPAGCMYFDALEKTLVIRNSIVFEDRDVTEDSVGNLFYFCMDLWLAASASLSEVLEGALSPQEAAAQTFDAFGKE